MLPILQVALKILTTTKQMSDIVIETYVQRLSRCLTQRGNNGKKYTM